MSAPARTEDALAELGGDGAKVLAGGQSLVPVLAMRLGRPSMLVDINAVPELSQVSRSNGHLRVGATVRQRQVQYDDAAAAVPLLRLALPWVGHREIRSRGTVCGSIAHADPAAELPAVASCLDATMVVASAEGVREIPAGEFFTGAMSTAILPEELLTEVRFPVAGDGEGFGFGEFARRHGDFALAGVAVRVRTTPRRLRRPDQLLRHLRPPGHPRRLPAAALRTRRHRRRPRRVRPASGAGRTGRGIAEDVVNTGGDAHASTAYRRQLIAGLVSRQVARAYLKSVRPTREGESS